MSNYFVLAYYYFTPLEDPEEEVRRHLAFFQEKDAKGRIYISKEGINGQMSASPPDAEAYIAWMHADPRFAKVDFKIHHYPEHAFPRMSVKLRSQLVALDVQVDPSEGGDHLSPAEWRKMLEERDAQTLLLDVRNDYEWEIGHFEGAELPKLETFREFPAYVQRLKQEKDPKETKVMMYCTGGIRCELYSALLKKEGFENVFQLNGGIIKYGLEEGNEQWRGKLFVFDDRLSVPIDENSPGEVISRCCFCEELSDVYYNCANMDCNELFLCCPECAEQYAGCCSQACREMPRVRPYEKGQRPKPFRKSYNYAIESSEVT